MSNPNNLATLATTLEADGSGNVLEEHTPAQFDNTTKLVDAAFVRQEGLEASNLTQLSAASTLPASAAGSSFYLAGASYTTTLPLAGSVPAGSRIEFMAGGSNLAIARQSTDILLLNAGVIDASVTLNGGDTLTLESNGVANWFAVGGSAQFSSSAAFESALSGAISTAEGTAEGVAESYAAGVASTDAASAASAAEGYAASVASSDSSSAQSTAETYARGLVYEYENPQGSFAYQDSGAGGTLAPSLTFSTGLGGVLFATGSKNNAGNDSSAQGGGLYINGGLYDGDTTSSSMTHSATLVVGGGTYTIKYQANSASVPFSVNVAFIFHPNHPSP